MDSNEFRKQGHQIIDWIADYFENINHYSVIPDHPPGHTLNKVPASPPLDSEDFKTIFQDFEKDIIPGMTHWQHPNFFGYFPANTSFPSILGELLTSAMGAQCMSWLTSPAATELEQRVMEWLQQALGLPEDFTGVIQDTASTATLCSILTARERFTKINKDGFYNQVKPFRIYCSSEAHSSIEKGVKIAGFGSQHLIKIAINEDFAMIPEALESAIIEDLKAGFQPLAIIAAFGTTSSTAIDPLEAIGRLAQKYKLWLHVDAAFAGSALILPEKRTLLEGMEYMDSFVFNPHKWLFTNFDCSAYFVKDPQALKHTFEMTPEYLKTEQDQQVNNYRDWGIQLGRRFRALKLWFVIRSFGLNGLQSQLRNHIKWAQKLSQMIDNHPLFERLAPVPFNTICFRYKPAAHTGLNEINQKLHQSINKSGKLFITHTKLNEQYTLRLVIGQTNVTWEHVSTAWKTIEDLAKSINPT